MTSYWWFGGKVICQLIRDACCLNILDVMFFESFSHGSMFAEHKNFRLKISSKPDKKISLFISISLFNLKVGDLFSGRSSSKEGSLSLLVHGISSSTDAMKLKTLLWLVFSQLNHQKKTWCFTKICKISLLKNYIFS